MKAPRLLWLASLPILALLVLPLGVLALQGEGSQFFLNLCDESVQTAIVLSLRSSLLAVLIGVLLGTPMAWLMARFRVPGLRLLETLIELPIVLPPAVAGIALLITFGRRGLVGQWLGLALPFTPAAVVLAQLFVAAPFYLKTATDGFRAVSASLEEAARVDGASPLQSFWHILLPLSRGSLMTGALLMWARALGEFGATIIFAGNLPGQTQTMPLVIYSAFEINLAQAMTLSEVLLALSLGVLLLARTALRAE